MRPPCGTRPGRFSPAPLAPGDGRSARHPRALPRLRAAAARRRWVGAVLTRVVSLPASRGAASSLRASTLCMGARVFPHCLAGGQAHRSAAPSSSLLDHTHMVLRAARRHHRSGGRSRRAKTSRDSSRRNAAQVSWGPGVLVALASPPSNIQMRPRSMDPHDTHTHTH